MDLAVKMKVRREVEVVAGDLILDCGTNEKGELEGAVEIAIGGNPAQTWDVSELERAAEALHQVRKELGDYRSVCPAHGYYGLKAEQNYECPQCRRLATHAHGQVEGAEEASHG
jgi:hypothetical protein